LRPPADSKRATFSGFADRFASLGALAARRPWRLIGFWLALFALAAIGARKAPARLYGGSGDVNGSQSAKSDSLLRVNFDNPFAQLLLLTVRDRNPARMDKDSLAASLATIIGKVEKSLSALPQVAGVLTPETMLDKRLLPNPDSGSLVMIGIKAASIRDAERAIPSVRAAVDAVLEPQRRWEPGLQWAVTGRSALTYDLNLFNSRDTALAELRVIPITLLILLFAFGSVVAAGVPLALGILCTTISMGLVFLLTRFWVLSNLVQNVSSMVGLAVGIDYSLLIIHRYRESLRAMVGSGAGPDREQRTRALMEAMGTAGKSVFYSGLTVMIGMGGMLFTPLMETRSVGWGGCIVVLVTVAAAMTFLPALLFLLGPALDWPRSLARKFGGGRRGRRWRAWSLWVMCKAPWCALAGLIAILVLSWPGRYTRFGFPEGPFIPAELEFSRGLAMLESMGMQGLVRPVNLILTAKEGPILAPERIPALYAFSARIRRDSAVARIFGPVDLADDWPLAKYTRLWSDAGAAFEQFPSVKEFFISRDGKSLLMQVMLRPDVGLEQEKKLARDIPGWLGIPDVTVDPGGQAVYYNDFDQAMIAAYPPTVAFVLAVTAAALLYFFRAPIVALKALIMNALSVLAGYGMVVFVFQLGYGHALFGTPGPCLVVPLTIPLMLFCIMFGLSMDYEVFLLSRIREVFLGTGDNVGSVAEGLSVTGPIITSAALIMAAVFGAFAFARVVVAQMLGLGLAVAVIVDATVVRVLLVPAFMKMLGKWNWWRL